MNEQPPRRGTVSAHSNPPDAWLSHFREIVTAAIAVVVVLCSALLILYTVGTVQAASADAFMRAKDILLFVNPILGLVIGYYFQKTTSEARSEHAEATARSASDRAEEATIERHEANAAAQHAQQRVREVESTLADVTNLAEQHLEESAPQQPGTLKGELPPPEPSLGELQLRLAIERARGVLKG
jgi:hypothetical protein